MRSRSSGHSRQARATESISWDAVAVAPNYQRHLLDEPLAPETTENPVVDPPAVHPGWLTNDPAWDYSGWTRQQTLTRALESWPVAGRGQGAIIAVIDTGVDATHPDLAGQTVAGWDFVGNDADPSDLNGHGTHVAGIIAAKVDNAIGTFGLEPEAKIMPLRVLDKYGSGSDANIAQAIIWAANHGANAINLSLGGPEDSAVLNQALAYARSKGTLPVCAAGNDGAPALDWPAASPSCLPVRALDAKGTSVTAWSSSGLSFDGKVHGVSAPGTEIWSSYPGANVVPMDGTSMASPMVAAAAGVMVARGNSPSAAQHLIESSALDLEGIGADPLSGYGALDLLQMAYQATGQEHRACSARQIPLPAGKAALVHVNLDRLCPGHALDLKESHTGQRATLQQTGRTLTLQVRYAYRWQMNRIVARLSDPAHPLDQPVLISFATPLQRSQLVSPHGRCGTTIAAACHMRSAKAIQWQFQGAWLGNTSQRNVRVHLSMMRMEDEATDSVHTRMRGNRNFLATLPSENFDPGIYKLTPARGKLQGQSVYLRVT